MTNNYYAKDALGNDIINHSDENLGSVEDMVISPEGNVEFIIVSYGGIFGTSLNDKLLAIPYSSFGWNDSKEALTLNISKDFMEAAPSFDKDNIPESSNNYYHDARTYHSNLDQHAA